MPRPAVQIDGARRLRAQLTAAGLGVQDLKDAHRAVAELIVTESRPDGPRRSGRLVGDERPAGTAREAIVRVGRKALPYAGPVHFGWPARGIEANPWISRAIDRNTDPVLELISTALQDIVDRIEGTPTS